MGIVHGKEAAHLVVGVILHPAAEITHLRDAGHTVIGVRRDAAVSLCHHGMIAHQVILIGGGGAVRILDGPLVARTVIGVLPPVALVVRGSSQLVQQLHLESGFAQPVFHSNQIAVGVVPITDFLGIIMIVF